MPAARNSARLRGTSGSPRLPVGMLSEIGIPECGPGDGARSGCPQAAAIQELSQVPRVVSCVRVQPPTADPSAPSGQLRASGQAFARLDRRLNTSPVSTRITARKNMIVPITLTCMGTPRWAEPHTNIGNVVV